MGLLGWTRKDVPDLRGKRAVITGGNSGIGFEVARQLLEHGAAVSIASRNLELTRQAARDLQEEFPGALVEARQVDLEDMRSVKALADELLSSDQQPIDLLICNAGRFLDASFATTPDGFEQTLAVNYWGHFYLTLLLLPRVLESEAARIIIMSSPAEQFGTLDLHDLKGASLRTSGIAAYGRAKLMELLFGQELQRRLRLTGKNVEAFVVHPGIVATALFNKVTFRYPFALYTKTVGLFFGQSPLQGAQSTVYAATEPSLTGKGGAYIGPQYSTNLRHAVLRKPANVQAALTWHNADARRRLWDESVRVLQEVVGGEVPNLPDVPVGP